ncbi:TPA: hypothetical protein ACNVU4_002922 [Morganella morganii]
MYTSALASSSSASQDISVSRFLNSTADGDSDLLIGLLIFSVQNTVEESFRCNGDQALLIYRGDASAVSDAGHIDIPVVDTTPLEYLSAYISLMKLQGNVSADSYLNKVQNNCERAIEQQHITQPASGFSRYLPAGSLTVTPDMAFDQAVTDAHRQQNTRLAETRMRLKFSKDQIQMTGQVHKMVENHAKPFLKVPVKITNGEINFS